MISVIKTSFGWVYAFIFRNDDLPVPPPVRTGGAERTLLYQLILIFKANVSVPVRKFLDMPSDVI